MAAVYGDHPDRLIVDIADVAYVDAMYVNLSGDLRQFRRNARRSYSTSLMSNTKWRAVFSALKDDKLRVRQIVAKFTDVDKPLPMGLPALHAPYEFVDSFEFGPFPLINIEWLEVPNIAIFPRINNVPAEKYSQDTIAVRCALLALGKRLPLEDTATGLRVVGLVR